MSSEKATKPKPTIKSLTAEIVSLNYRIAQLLNDKDEPFKMAGHVFDFLEAVKERMKVRNYPVKQTGGLRLLRADIPREISEPVPLYMDKSSHLTLAINATILGVTPDELIRNLVWTFNEAYEGKFKR